MSEQNKSWLQSNPKAKKPKPIKRKKSFKIFSFFDMQRVYKAFKKNRPLTVKILYTMVIILVFRLGSSITLPGVHVPPSFSNLFGGNNSSFIGVLDMLGGGALRNFSVLALGISPFITASIIMQLLQSEAFPPLYRLSKSGPRGKRIINIITRILTFAFAVMQAIVIISQFSGQAFNIISLKTGFDTNLFKFFIFPAILVGGAMFSLFLGEQITNKGVGNGTSLLIFSGIVVQLPSQFRAAYKDLMNRSPGTPGFVGLANFAIYILYFLVLLYIVTYFYKSERHVPIQQTGAGLTTDKKRMSRLPIKLNPAGVMPVIFPLMLLTLPQQISQFFPKSNAGRIWIMENLKFTSPIGMSLLIFFIFIFSLGMALLTFNPSQIAENFKKQGTFIPGIRPGKDTENYLVGVVIRLAVFSGFYLSFITIIKYVAEIIGFSQVYTFGGTSLLILASVAAETINQLNARKVSNKISRARMNTQGKDGEDKVKGLLW